MLEPAGQPTAIKVGNDAPGVFNNSTIAAFLYPPQVPPDWSIYISFADGNSTYERVKGHEPDTLTFFEELLDLSVEFQAAEVDFPQVPLGSSRVFQNVRVCINPALLAYVRGPVPDPPQQPSLGDICTTIIMSGRTTIFISPDIMSYQEVLETLGFLFIPGEGRYRRKRKRGREESED
jgi:hypothetical protein